MHVRCPDCHHPIEIVDDSSLSDLSCPACGSHVGLITDDYTATYLGRQARQLGHFKLLEQIGMGRFGSVWSARDTTLDRIVAIKIPRKEQLDATEAELFFREARAAAQLRHPNIVQVYEVGRDENTIF